MPATDYLVVDALPDSVDILAPSGARDSRGNRLPGETVVAQVPGEVRSGGLLPREQEIAAQIAGQTVYAVDLPYDAPVEAKHRLRVNGDRTFEVAGVVREGNWRLLTTAVCTEVR
jgi:hypothetical protein